MSFLTKIFGDANEKYLKNLQPIVEKINSLEEEFERFSSERLKEKTAEFKQRLEKKEALNDILPEAFAQVREAAKRTLNQRHFDCQLIGGIVLHEGKIAEMKTGEGKTLAATLSLYLNALEGKGCHLVTVNDYLAKRDAVWMGQIYHALGLSIGCIVHDVAYIYDPSYVSEKRTEDKEEVDKERDTVGGFKVVENYLRPVSRKEAYLADITYGTNNELGFDYLRDNMVYDLNQQVQRGFHYAIVDEVDSILIDEARTPLIISAPAEKKDQEYYYFVTVADRLEKDNDYTLDEKHRALEWTEKGEEKIAKILEKDPWVDGDLKTIHRLENAVRAKEFFILDKDYVIKNGEIVIVDEFTGRLMPGRRWSGGIHQAVEAKAHVKEDKRVEVKAESMTLASVTFQNLFRMYKKLAGMTGTAATSGEEFHKVYGLEVAIIPTNKPMIRSDFPDIVYKTEKEKLKAIVKEIKEKSTKGQPILVGTRSVEKNEYLGKLLNTEGIPHQILNAKNHEKEGQIIAQAGRQGAVTIATNMAGRGVDIVLGGNPPSPEETKKVIELGGLHVIATERHEARRTDDQLRGRAGRQGDPGFSQFFLSLDDDLMRIFGGDRIKSLMSAFKIPEDQPIEAKLISGVIESSQAKIEGMNFDLRKHLLDYDDVLNKHREVIYKKRREMLKVENWEEKMSSWIKDPKEKELFQEKKKELENNFNSVAKLITLRTLDMLWMDHLENMEHLRDSVRLRAYGQQDPLVEYKSEGHKMFKQLLSMIEAGVIQTFLKVNLTKQPSPTVQPQEPNLDVRRKEKPDSSANARSFLKNQKKTGRNDPCPCGAKKPDGRPLKYKHCHGRSS